MTTTRKEAVASLNKRLTEFLVPSGQGIDEFEFTDEELRLHVLRHHDWSSTTLEGNGCFRLRVVLASVDAIPLTGVVVSAYNAETGDSVGEEGHLNISEGSPTEYTARVRLLPFGGIYRLQLSIPEDIEE